MSEERVEVWLVFDIIEKSTEKPQLEIKRYFSGLFFVKKKCLLCQRSDLM